ncbi:MAG: ABC transporter permease [Thermoleophilia bacterium]
MSEVSLRRAQWRGVLALVQREVVGRVLRLWSQTLAPQVVVAALFVVVFGVALGHQIRLINGVPYQEFVVPGLTLMGVATAAFANNATSLYQARGDGFIEDPVSSPMTPTQLTVGYTVGGVVRGLIIGTLTLAAARVFVAFPLRHPLVLAAALVATAVAFAALGNVVGLHSKGWELQALVGNLVIQPLVFLGGVFYSVRTLDGPWRRLSHADPILYMVEATRHGVLGGGDVSLPVAMGVTVALAVAMTCWSWVLFRRGVGLRT